MNKKVLTKVFLPLLPTMAVLLATTGDSVKIYNIPAGTVESCSYFTLLPVTNMQIVTPLAAIGAVVALFFALVYVMTGKRWCVRGVFYTAFLSTCAAACPNLIHSEIMVMPNVIFPLLMAALCLLAYRTGKKPENKVSGPRLDLKR